ncbi:MAG: diguanylate cyclase [Burkholderiaceae bacterium]
MAAVAPHFLRLKFDQLRPSAIGVIAVALMAGGVLLAVRSMTVEEEVRNHYEEALALSQLALEAQQASADLRSRQRMGTRGLSTSALPTPPPDPVAMQGAVSGLRARIDEISGFQLSSDEQRRLDELKRALADISVVSKELVEAIARDAGSTETARELAARSERRFEVFEDSLAALVGSVRLRTVNIARRAEQLNSVSRNALMGMFGVTLVLGLLAVLLALRTLKANRALLNRMQQLAREDALTGAVNRRGLDDVLSVEFARAHRSGEPLTLVMIDLDHFKRYNDRRGHPAGDAVLRGAAQAWLKQLRPTDMLARYGGEEFTLVLPGTDARQAAQLVDRLRPPVPDRQTFSAGVASWDGHETATEVLRRADAALLQAKKSGRNRTMIAGQEPQVTLPLMVA